MANSKTKKQRLITHLGHKLGVALTLEGGVCALYDSAQVQAAVIELPENSDQLILHCRLGSLRPGPDNPQRLLGMNFDVATLRGCWLALDQSDVRLCTQSTLEHLDEERFCNLISGFIAQVGETRAALVRTLM